MLQMTNEINTKIQKFYKCGSVNNHIKKLSTCEAYIKCKIKLCIYMICGFLYFHFSLHDSSK